ncbi:uncharacterized protein ACIB01_000643 [Guaruba guarouba]
MPRRRRRWRRRRRRRRHRREDSPAAAPAAAAAAAAGRRGGKFDKSPRRKEEGKPPEEESAEPQPALSTPRLPARRWSGGNRRSLKGNEMIAVSLKLVRKEREGLRTPTASRPGRHLNSLRIAPLDRPPPARSRRRRSVRPGRAAATGCSPQPRNPSAVQLRPPPLSSAARGSGGALPAEPPRPARQGSAARSVPRRQPCPFRTRAHPFPVGAPPQPSPAATLGHGTLPPSSLSPPLAPVRWAQYLSPELEPCLHGARPPHGVTAVAARAPASPRTSSRRPPQPHSPERRAADRSPAHIQPFGSHLAGAAAARAPLRACGRSVGGSRSGRDR